MSDEQPEQPQFDELGEEEVVSAVSGEEGITADEEAEELVARRRLTYGTEFSPEQVGNDLRGLLEIVATAKGRPAQIRALTAAYPAIGKSGPKRVGNMLISLQAYGLYDSGTKSLTSLGEELRAETDDAVLHEKFARHILASLEGMALLQVVHDLRLRDEKAQKATMDRELRQRNFKVPGDTTNHLTMLKWLAKSDVCRYEEASWQYDDDRLRQLAGIGLAEVDDFSALTQVARLFLMTLQRHADVHGKDPVLARSIRSEMEDQYAVEFKGQMSKVLDDLEQKGFLVRTGKASGQSGSVAATDKLIKLDIDEARRLSTGLIPAELRKLLNTSLQEVYRDLASDDKNKRGVALEVLALRLAYAVGLTPMGFRVRSADTGQAEVDLIAEGANLMFSRWLFQCKAVKGRVALPALAKEIGMAAILRAHVVVMVTRGTFSKDLVEHARKAAESTNLQVILIDDRVLKAFRTRGTAAIVDHLLDTAAATLRTKRDQVAGVA